MLPFLESLQRFFDHGREKEALEVLADLHGGAPTNGPVFKVLTYRCDNLIASATQRILNTAFK